MHARLCGVDADAPFAAMGKEVSEEERNKKSWDSNAITPGTPFMDLLANSLRYWVVKKLNTDPGWKNVGSHSFLPLVTIQF
jgi:5'-3' exoribonuclease 2